MGQAILPEHELSELRADEDERQIIGILLRGVREHVAEARRVVEAADFHLEKCRKAFAAIEGLDDNGQPALFTSVIRQIQRDGVFWQTAASDLATMAYECPTSMHLRWHCLNVAQAAQRRRLLSASGKIATTAEDNHLSADDAVKRAEEIISAVPRRSHGQAALVDPLEMATMAAVRNADVAEGGDTSAIPTGLYDLDQKLAGGVRPGQLIVVGARPGVGKSAIMRRFARDMARRGCILYASDEMTLADLNARDTAVYSGVPLPEVIRGKYDAADHAAIIGAEAKIAETSIVNYVDPAMTSSTLRARALELNARWPVVAVVLDYLQRLADPGRSGLERVGASIRAMKSLALELNVPVIVGSQLSRPTDKNVDIRPTLVDLRETGEIEQEADVVLLLYRASAHYANETEWRERGHRTEPWPGNVAEINIAKQRQGEAGVTIRVAWLPTVADFASLRGY